MYGVCSKIIWGWRTHLGRDARCYSWRSMWGFRVFKFENFQKCLKIPFLLEKNNQPSGKTYDINKTTYNVSYQRIWKRFTGNGMQMALCIWGDAECHWVYKNYKVKPHKTPLRRLAKTIQAENMLFGWKRGREGIRFLWQATGNIYWDEKCTLTW